MRKYGLLLLLAVLPLLASAQMKFGYLSYEEAFKSLPEYALAQANLADLKAKYDAEMKPDDIAEAPDRATGTSQEECSLQGRVGEVAPAGRERSLRPAA